MKKYYMVKVFTPYVGEETYHYLQLEDDVDYYDMVDEIINEWIYENAVQWWDFQSSEEYEEDFDTYLEECGHTATEITEEEFLEGMKDYGFTSIDLEI